MTVEGPRADFESVYLEHAAFVWRLVLRLGVPRPVVPDLVQDVFLVVHRRLADFDGRTSTRAWLAGIARGIVRNHARGRVRERRRLRALSDHEPPREPGLEARVELGHTLAALLDELSEEQRLAIVLIEIEGFTPGEAAAALGVSRNTVYSRLRLARGKLRARLRGAQNGTPTGGSNE